MESGAAYVTMLPYSLFESVCHSPGGFRCGCRAFVLLKCNYVKTKLKPTMKDVQMREERANFRFLILSVFLLLIAVLISVLSFVSLVNAGNESSSSVSSSQVFTSGVNDLSYTQDGRSSNDHP